MIDLSKKTAFVTGAANGIGKRAAEELGRCGANVMLGDINEKCLISAVDAMKKEGINAEYVVINVKDVSNIQEAMKKTAELFGGIDILVNSAGILGTATIEDTTEKEWNQVIGVDLSGTFFASQSALPYLKASKAGRIINIASLAGRNGGFAGSCAYAAAKGGVIAVTRNMARNLALAGHKITVNVICPGPIDTRMHEGYSQEKKDLELAVIPLNRFGTDLEVAAAICHLASDEAGFTTGATLDINGGAFIG